MLGDLDRARLELGLRAVAIWKPGGVAEVQVVLGGQRHEQLVQHGQAADAGVEHPDGLMGKLGHCGRMVPEAGAGGPRRMSVGAIRTAGEDRYARRAACER